MAPADQRCVGPGDARRGRDDGSRAPVEVTSLVSGADGNLWFTEQFLHVGRIARLTPAGSVTEFPLPGEAAGETPLSITRGPDGNLWFTYTTLGISGVFGIARITPAGVITEFPLPSSAVHGGVRTIVTGGDGNLWVTEVDCGIAVVTPAGIVSRQIAGVNAYNIAAGPDGNIWFVGIQDHKLHRIGAQ